MPFLTVTPLKLHVPLVREQFFPTSFIPLIDLIYFLQKLPGLLLWISVQRSVGPSRLCGKASSGNRLAAHRVSVNFFYFFCSLSLAT